MYIEWKTFKEVSVRWKKSLALQRPKEVKTSLR